MGTSGGGASSAPREREPHLAAAPTAAASAQCSSASVAYARATPLEKASH